MAGFTTDHISTQTLMNIHIRPEATSWPALLTRPAKAAAQLDAIVSEVLSQVRAKGDEAVRAYTEQFDDVRLENLLVTEEEFAKAERELPINLKQAILTAKSNIETFHKTQREPIARIETMPGVSCWRKSVAIESVGLYIPGGTAPLFSSVLMLGIPAQIAGCREIVLCSPPQSDGQIHPATLFSARICGITQVYKAGGIQAIGAMAYGTETLPAVYKIFGPGNQYVTAAKQAINREGTAIDMPAGPSEVMVVADESAVPAFVAADLLSQAEHGADSQVILVAFDEAFVQAVLTEVEQQLALLPRAEIAREALTHSQAIIVDSRVESIQLVNAYAPEHLILAVQDAEAYAAGIQNAGSVFLGNYTPESVGDYASGTNHTLPTNGYARSYSGVSLDSFIKKITFQRLTPEGLSLLGPTVEIMAEAEKLIAHKQAVSLRLESLKS